MFSIERRGSAWVLRADGADLMVVRSKWIAKKILREASAGAARQNGRTANAGAPQRRGRRSGDIAGPAPAE